MPKKCEHCQKKIKGMVHQCSCDLKKLCTKCRLPESHNCTFDFQKKQKESLKEKLVKVEHHKVIYI
jgi:predicted nucleic acid binding AN1-type Zn finger protein